MICVIDNYDSFVYNIVQYLGKLDAEVKIFRNDQISVGELSALKPDGIVLSPGPCTPSEAGVCLDICSEMKGEVSILGVCLGHQSIAVALGGRVIRAKQVKHGKVSYVYHDGRTLFRGVKNPFQAARYHSLIVDRNGFPDSFEISAWTDSGIIMGIRHKKYPLEGIQFHPESIMTQEGMKILQNFLSII